MKTFLKQYFTLWIKFLVMIPGIAFMRLNRLVMDVYTLFSAALLGDGKSFDGIVEDTLIELGL